MPSKESEEPDDTDEPSGPGGTQRQGVKADGAGGKRMFRRLTAHCGLGLVITQRILLLRRGGRMLSRVHQLQRRASREREDPPRSFGDADDGEVDSACQDECAIHHSDRKTEN